MEFAQVVKKVSCAGATRIVTFRARCSIGSWIWRFGSPSAGNAQPQEFIVIESQETKDQLARAALDQSYIVEAPVVIVVVSDTRRSRARYGTRGEKFYSIVDGGIIPTGFCAEPPQKVPRFSKEPIIHYERWIRAMEGL